MKNIHSSRPEFQEGNIEEKTVGHHCFSPTTEHEMKNIHSSRPQFQEGSIEDRTLSHHCLKHKKKT
jgi:hypothetical protein